MSKFAPTRERKHRKIAKEQKALSTPRNEGDQANQLELRPLTATEKDERRAKLQAELKAQQPESRVSAKKRKRLDKYIDTKLKKEENLELLKKLAAQKIDTSLLQSSKKLGRTNETKRERFSRALAEKNVGIDVDGQQDAILYERRQEPVRGTHSDSENGDETPQIPSNGAVEQVATESKSPGLFGSGGLFGGGLKRPLETDETGQPVIKRRKRERNNKKAKPDFVVTLPEPDEPSDSEASDEWNGFSGDESEAEAAAEDTSDDDDGDSESLDESEDTEADDGSSESDDDSEGDNAKKPARVSAFKAWADSQRNQAVGFTPSAAPTNDEAIKAAFEPRAPSPDPVASEILVTSKAAEEAYRPSKALVIPRDDAVQEARSQLPVVQDEQKIVEAINNNSVTIVCGATGSGKTTQLPQMLLENGYASKGMIGVTQPRRVAATSVAKRVQYELGPEFGTHVGAQVRFTSTVSRDTRVKFMTDGILLREISQDFALSKYSAIVLDEAHERSVNTDILIGMLSRIVPLRLELSKEDPAKHHPLKLIIMSATLRVTDFLMNARLFRNTKPPIVQAEGRQYPVTEHFARRTQRDYVAEMVRKVSRGHKKLPPGDILVFLTGQDDIQIVAKRLREAFTGDQEGFQNSHRRAQPEKPVNDYLEADEGGDASDDEAEITGLDDDEGDTEFAIELDPTMSGTQRGALRAQILPLYAALPAAQQDLVFQKTADGIRKIILATNVAETSLTIDGVRYVFDCGRSKEKVYDVETGVQEFKVDWISKASASQRMGRAGRTGPGHCYRLYSSAIYEAHFEEHTLPEILRTPIEGTVLQLKNMSVDNVVNFPYPTPPAGEQLSQAERLLKNLGAIDNRTGKITDIGKQLINYPVNPRFGRMLLLGKQNDVLIYTIALVAGLAVGDLFIPQPQLPRDELEDEDSDDGRRGKASILADTQAEKGRQAYGRAMANLASQDDKSDAIKVLTAVAAHAQAESQGNASSFCAENFLREKGMSEAQQLRRQLHDIMQRHVDDPSSVGFTQTLAPPSDREKSILKQIVAAGYIDQVAIRRDLLPNAVSTGRKPRRAIEVPYKTLLPSKLEIDDSVNLQDQELQKSVFVHASSVLARLSLSEMPSFAVYSNLSRATSSHIGEAQKRTRMHPLCTVSQKQLAVLAEGSPLLEIGKPIGKIEELGTSKRQCWIGVALRDPAAVGTMGWPLGAWKVIQTRKGKDWTIEKVLDRGK
ncbi:putative ATP-dependent RNA helicase PB1A10.06c [Pseudocercospora fuligena]|uniref:RNA helicase n=1 Tax=Pseudocercospora fuligena TaxID=685502 RepID=A0A8H6R8F2_9PEZI|nr:putative ATP-dependent RNA helicase PB1A10.06c [Pseudocercospora fuligena]